MMTPEDLGKATPAMERAAQNLRISPAPLGSKRREEVMG